MHWKVDIRAIFFIYIRKDEQLPVPVAFCDLKLHQKRHICNFRKYHPISFKFAIQVHNWKP